VLRGFRGRQLPRAMAGAIKVARLQAADLRMSARSEKPIESPGPHGAVRNRGRPRDRDSKRTSRATDRMDFEGVAAADIAVFICEGWIAARIDIKHCCESRALRCVFSGINFLSKNSRQGDRSSSSRQGRYAAIELLCLGRGSEARVKVDERTKHRPAHRKGTCRRDSAPRRSTSSRGLSSRGLLDRAEELLHRRRTATAVQHRTLGPLISDIRGTLSGLDNRITATQRMEGIAKQPYSRNRAVSMRDWARSGAYR